LSALATDSIAVEDASSPAGVDANPVSFPVSRQCSVHLRRGNPLNLGTSIFQVGNTLSLREINRHQDAR